MRTRSSSSSEWQASSARSISSPSASSVAFTPLRGRSGGRDPRQIAERARLAHGEIGQHLAVEVDARLLQALHQPAVAQAVQPRGGVDAHDPEAAEVTLADLAGAVGIGETLLDGLARLAVAAATAADVAF